MFAECEDKKKQGGRLSGRVVCRVFSVPLPLAADDFQHMAPRPAIVHTASGCCREQLGCYVTRSHRELLLLLYRVEVVWLLVVVS